MTASSEPTSVQRAGALRTPDFFIVGHAKSGTSALYRMLRARPQIFMPESKEPAYFVPELRSPHQRKERVRHPETWEGYLDLFAPARPDQRTGEATPSYLFSHEAAARIAEACPRARIVAILREPASFLRSLHLQLLKTDVETEKDLRKALALEQRRREGKSLPPYSPRPQLLMYSDHVRYAQQLQRYREVFAPEQMLVLIYDDYRADNDGTVRRVLRFLDVDDSGPIEVQDVNPAKRVRSPRVQELVRSVYKGRGPVAGKTKAAIKAATPRRLRHEAISVSRRAQLAEPEPVDEAAMLELRRRFKGEVVACSEYLARDLVTLWGYDGIA
jgi:hypothetical protein